MILNTQLDKDDYIKIKEEIVINMKKEGTYGQFFPPALSVFGYNETLAKEYFPMDKDTANKTGFRWQDQSTGIFGKETIKKDDMPESIADVDEGITKEILVCESCEKNFKITKAEFDFYKRMSIPLPRKDFECRHQERMMKRTPRKLWHRKCQCAGTDSDDKAYKNTIEHTHHGKDHCPNEFETSYASDRKEVVYCEKCYQGEVV